MHRFLSKSQRSLVSSMSRLPSPVLSQFRRGIVSFSRSSSSGAAQQPQQGPAEAEGADKNNSSGGPSKQLKPLLRIQSIFNVMDPKTKYTIPQTASIEDGINHLVNNKLPSALTVAEGGEIAGIFTARDVLRFLKKEGPKKALGKALSALHTSKERLIFCSLGDSVRKCREIMFQLKIRNLPIIEDGVAMGIVTVKDLHDSAFSIADIGGKKGFIGIAKRKGLPEGTRMLLAGVSSAEEMGSLSALSAPPQLAVDTGSFSLPHPFKKIDGCASGRRDYGAQELCNDDSLCEDAHFAISVQGAAIKGSASRQAYMCVADGVGSWRQHGVDPRNFSHKLVENAKKVIESDALQRELLAASGFGGETLLNHEPIHPIDVIMDAWYMTTSERVCGSSTVCVATVDYTSNQLSYSNIGDCGLMILRHIDSETAGYMRERQVPRHLRKNDLRIAYLSQQQLRSFNLPYQLGFSDIPTHKGCFETPSDADSASIPVMPGDIILMATDGLFDNVDLTEITEFVSAWEKKWFADGSDAASNRSKEAVEALAREIVVKARELSLIKNRDSPFALLAKENDIMWGGGMPDDCSVVVARVSRTD